VNDTVLVLGATGKTGRRLVPLLAGRGVPVRAASRHPAPAAPGVEPVAFDWSDPSGHDAALAGTGAVYLVAPALVTDATAQVLPLLDRIGDRRVVLLSAWGVDAAGEEVPMRRVELAVEALGGTVLRPNWFAENFSESFFAPGIAERGEIAGPAADGRVSFVSAVDIAAVAAEALTGDGHRGRGYAISGPEALSFDDVAVRIAKAAGRPVRYVAQEPAAARAGLLAAGLPADYAELLLGLYANIRAGYNATVTGDVEAVTGRPPVAFAEYAESAAAAWR
jgi:uncharacterized protein YbjT (DUF2867 family)